MERTLVEGTGAATGSGSDRLPAPARVRAIERPAGGTVRAPVAAAGGFVAGLATLLVVRAVRRGFEHRRLLAPRRRGPGSLEIAASRSFLIDVHLLKR